ILWTILPHPGVPWCGVEASETEDEFSLDFTVMDFEMGSESPGESPEKKEEPKDKSEKGDGESKLTMDSPPQDTSKFKGTNWEKLINNLESTKDLRKKYEENFDGIFDNSNVSGKYIRRHRHYEDMIVKEVFPTIYSIDKDFKDEIQESEEVLENHNERNKIIEDFRNHNIDPDEYVKLEIEKNLSKDKDDKLTPLKMNENERDKYLDRILTDSKESQMQDFVNKFSGYDPSKGDLPLVYRDLYYKNLQRLAYTFSSDPTYFTSDYFEENLNKEDYLRNAMSLVSKLKNSKTSTEILFTILDIYEIQERAIFQYFQNETNWSTYSEEQKKQIRVETIRRVIEKYRPIFKNKNIQNYEDVVNLYFNKKKQIVDYLISTTPENYRKADGYFEKGRIHWERFYRTGNQEELQKARQAWSEVKKYKNSESEFLNKNTYDSMLSYLPALSTPGNSNFQINKEAVNNLLNSKMASHLEKKRRREERLLWQKN
ncbi:MAG: hypothetical protein KDK36_08400, partial [Leptospiraceae bacterium]|nr:hypothetical protein [Leptospiraceae bacterium]